MRRPATVDLILAATVLIWAFNVTVTRYVLTHGFQPLAYGALRYAAAAVLAVSVALFLERSLSVGGRRSLLLIALAAGFLLINQVSFVYALKLSSATTVALIMGDDADLHGDRRVARRAGAADAPVLDRDRGRLRGRRAGRAGLGRGHFVRPRRRPARDRALGVVGLLLGPDRTADEAVLAVRISAVVLCVMCVPFVALSSPQIASQDYSSISP